MENTLEDPHGRDLIQGSNVRSGFSEPLNTVLTHLLGGKIFGLESKLREHLLHRNAFAAVLREPRLTFTKADPVFLGYRFIISSRICARIEHRLQQPANDLNLRWSKAVYQFVNLLLFLNDVG